MIFNYEISSLALSDLDSIWFYTQNKWSTKQANIYYKEIIAVIENLCNHPEIGKPLDEVKKGHRRINMRFHMIIYKIQGSRICIDRILHQSMDFTLHINEF